MKPNAAPDLSDVSIVVLSRNRRDVLRRNLTSLMLLAKEHGCEIIVVDNASTDGSAEMISEARAIQSSMRFIANETNLGVAGGRNTGWRAASRDYILNIDDDTLITAQAVATMLSVMDQNPRLGIISPRILHAATGAEQFSFRDPDYRPSNFHGACHLVRRAVIDSVGLNDEGCSFGGEELDLSIRTRVAGFEIGYAEQATILHDNSVRRGQDGGIRRERWLYNFIRVHHKHFPFNAALPFSLRYLVSHLISGMRAHGSFFGVRLLVAAIRGFRDGRRQHNGVPEAVVRFYLNPHLRPEFGNVPLWRKLAGKLGWRFATTPRAWAERA